MHGVLSRFEEAKKVCKDDQAAAMLVLADSIQSLFSLERSTLSHHICMGLRMGLFGADARENATILNLRPDSE